jgi:hypothetical protein
MKRWLPVVPFLVACTAFATDHERATIADGGASSSSSSGSTATDGGADELPVVDAGGCAKIGPVEQPFTGGSLGSWGHSPGATPTVFTQPADGGKAHDGSVLFSYPADAVNARRDVVEKALPSSARCFELVVDFNPKQVDYKELVFTEVKFQNDHLIGLALDTQYHVILGQQDSSLVSSGFNELTHSNVPIQANVWHSVILRLEFLTRSFTATVVVDGGETFGSTNPLLNLDYTKSVEVGVSYVGPTGAGQIEIDRVAFQ